MVEYFKVEGGPDKPYFRCERQRATLSVEACSAMWRDANHNNVERLYKCKTCPLGAVHAGETAASMSPMMGTTICARCHVMAPRLIRRMVCVSCYNREREFVIGKNAKGTKPVKLAPLSYRRIRYMAGDEPKFMALERSVDTLELVVATLRDSKQAVRFGFHSQVRGVGQLRLF